MSPFLDDYEPVEDRLRAFWTDHPYGRVITELLPERHDGEYIVFASVFVGNELRNDPPTATGLASEFAGTSGVNKTSALENCETSAIGRALANMGYAAKGKRPSREEMRKTAGAGRTGNPVPPPAPASQSDTGNIGSGPSGSRTDSEYPVVDAVAADPKELGEGPEDAAATATSEQWDRLLAVVGGSEAKALTRLNRINKTNIGRTTKHKATVEQLALAISGGAE